MKDWVKPYVLERILADLADSGKDGSEKDQWIEIKTQMLESKEVLYHELISCLNCHFEEESGGFFATVFGSVLADLPEGEFEKLSSMENLFFIYTSSPQAEKKVLDLERGVTQRRVQIVVFPYDSHLQPSRVLQGEIVQQLVRVRMGLGELKKQEDQIESIGAAWGFEEAIRAAREYKRKGEPERQKGAPSKRQRQSVPGIQKAPAVLLKRRGQPEKTVHGVKQPVTTIGRGGHNNIVLRDPTVSRRHAEICFEKDTYILYDEASKNGTKLNGRSIHNWELSDGDIIGIGPFTLTFLTKQPP
jgi:hypothetical protein